MGLKDKMEDAAVQLASKSYDDLAKPAAQDAGKLLGAVTGFFNHVVTAPLHKLNARFEIQTKAYIENLQKQYLDIPVENRQEPALNIVGPTLEALRYNLDEEELKEMFTNLLLSSMDNRVSQNCHPAFVEIIKQLNSNDAKLLKALAERCKIRKGDYPLVMPKCVINKSPTTNKYTEYIGGLFPEVYIAIQVEGLSIFDISKSLHSLERVGVVEINNVTPLVREDLYDKLERAEEIRTLFDDKAKTGIDCGLIFFRRSYRFTEYGEDFVNSCVN